MHRVTAQEFISKAILRVKEMVSLIIKRQMDEEEQFEDDTDCSSGDPDDLESGAERYHNQIDALIRSSHSFLLERFAERKDASVNGQHSLKTLSVFAVHAATLLAIKRDFPLIHRSALNGFTRTLSFQTPNTMPNVQPPQGMLVSYSSEEESFMHKQTEVFEQEGMRPLVRNLLQLLGGNDRDYSPLCDHLDLAARQASSTYLPHIAEK